MKEKTEEWLEDQILVLKQMDESDLSGALIRTQLQFPDFVREDWEEVVRRVRSKYPNLIQYFIDEKPEWETGDGDS